MKAAAIAIGAKPLEYVQHKFSDGGLTAMLIISESHLALHTWPEEGLALIDIFTCNEKSPDNAVEIFRQFFNPETVILKHNTR